MCVEESQRRKGIATRMLRAYLPYVNATTPELEKVALLCKDNLVRAALCGLLSEWLSCLGKHYMYTMGLGMTVDRCGPGALFDF